MPASTRAHYYEPSPMELSTERRDLRHHLRTTSMDALRLAEDNEDNISNGIVYTPDLRKQILLAYTDDFGYILPANKAHIHLNFRERTAWTFGTHFPSSVVLYYQAADRPQVQK